MKRITKCWSLGALGAVATLVASDVAFAQEAEAGGQAQLGGQAGGQAQVGMALPGAAPEQQAAAVQGESDHDLVIGTVAVGYLGRRGLLIAADPGTAAITGGATPEQVDAPVIGIRYWIDEMLGIDAGLGFEMTSGSTKQVVGQTSQETDIAGITAFIFHGGVPLSLASEGSFSFEIVPELNVGFASRSRDVPAAPPNAAGTFDTSGFHLDIGARAGAEIQFGFIDIPRLSLQGTVGLSFETDNIKMTAPNGAEASRSTSRIGTTVQDNPWNIFTSNVAALYYF